MKKIIFNQDDKEFQAAKRQFWETLTDDEKKDFTEYSKVLGLKVVKICLYKNEKTPKE